MTALGGTGPTRFKDSVTALTALLGSEVLPSTSNPTEHLTRLNLCPSRPALPQVPVLTHAPSGHAPYPHLSWSKLHRSIAYQALEGNGGLEDIGGA